MYSQSKPIPNPVAMHPLTAATRRRIIQTVADTFPGTDARPIDYAIRLTWAEASGSQTLPPAREVSP